MLKRFSACERGNYAVLTAITMVPLMAAVAGVVDFTGTSNDAAKLQDALDATGLAIGTRYYSGMTQAELTQLGEQFFEANMLIATSQDLQVADGETLPNLHVSASENGNAHFISVTSSIHHEGFVGAMNWNARRNSYVKVAPGQPACVLALDPTASDAIKIQGSAQVSMPGCVIASNSNASDSAYRGGSAKVKAACVLASGTTVGFGSNSDLECGKPLEHQYPSFDPLEDVTPPAYTACQLIPGGKSVTLSPGTYCNKDWNGTITLNPGVYILRGIDVKLGGNASLTGSGVTLFLMDGAQFTANANNVINLSPPSTGTYAGITIFQDRGNTEPMTINGTSGSNVSGFIYAPNAPITYTGNSDMTATGNCLRVVGDTVEMNGNSAVKSDCTAELEGRKAYAGRVVTLVK
jgi:Flp pilus assembly protein TadG